MPHQLSEFPLSKFVTTETFELRFAGFVQPNKGRSACILTFGAYDADRIHRYVIEL